VTVLKAGALLLALACTCGCAHTHYVPVCSEHGGVRSRTVTDRNDRFATWDYTCRDGTAERPEQIEDANGHSQLVVPSER
jgi:hypothetical protein